MLSYLYNSNKVDAMVNISSIFTGQCISHKLALIFTAMITINVGHAHAQDDLEVPDISVFRDVNGFNVLSGRFADPSNTISVGDPKNGGLVYTRYSNSARRSTSNLSGRIRALQFNTGQETGEYFVIIGDSAKEFWTAGAALVEAKLEGHKLERNPERTIYNYTTPDGTVYVFQDRVEDSHKSYLLQSISEPNGNVSIYHYDLVTRTPNSRNFALRSITNSSGYQIRFNDQGDEVLALNNAFEYCPKTGGACAPVGQDWQKLTLTSNCPTLPPYGNCSDTVNQNGLVTTYNFNELERSINFPIGRTVTYRYGTNGIQSVTTPSGVWNYQTGNPTWSTDPIGGRIAYYYDYYKECVNVRIDEVNRAMSMFCDEHARLSSVVNNDENRVDFTYDDRGNITERREIAKPGSGFADLVSTAGYDLTCVYRAKCNKPNWVQDAAGNRTDYTYDGTTGLLLVANAPPNSGGVRAVTANGYQQIPTYSLNASGGLDQIGNVWRIAVTATCQKTAGSVAINGLTATLNCAGGAGDLLRTTTSYAGSLNALATSITLGAGDGSVSATTAMSYDNVGNIIALDGPLPGSADTTRSYYNVLRQIVGVVEPDPDAAGPLQHPATRTTYNADGQVTLSERGITSNQSETAMSTFVAQSFTRNTYDQATGQLVKSEEGRP